MFNLITHKINNERSDYLYTHFLLETNGSAPGGIEYHSTDCCQTRWKNNILSNEVQEETDKFFLFLFY